MILSMDDKRYSQNQEIVNLNDLRAKQLLASIEHGLIVSCQAPPDSPLHNNQIISAMAQVAVNQGAVAVRIDTPSHVQAVRQKLGSFPIIGLWKQQIQGYEVYITPRYEDALAIAEAGADIIAIDGTLRPRPLQENLPDLVTKIQQQLGKLVMADVDSIESAAAAAAAGVDLIGTTLYGYTHQTLNCHPPGWQLLTQIVATTNIPAICEGGVSNPQMAQKALALGAYAVVVGTAITGIDRKLQDFMAVFSQ